MPGVLPFCYPSNLVLFACHSLHVIEAHLSFPFAERLRLKEIKDLGSNAGLPDSQA